MAAPASRVGTVNVTVLACLLAGGLGLAAGAHAEDPPERSVAAKTCLDAALSRAARLSAAYSDRAAWRNVLMSSSRSDSRLVQRDGLGCCMLYGHTAA